MTTETVECILVLLSASALCDYSTVNTTLV